jgi:hypothetical protein
MLIYVTDAAELRFCLLLRSFLSTKAVIRIIRARQTIPHCTQGKEQLSRAPLRQFPRALARAADRFDFEIALAFERLNHVAPALLQT